MAHFDLVIIGTGSGNMIVNRHFADWSVALVEENKYGGTCLNVGCIPTKMFVVPSDLVREAERGPELGVHTRFDGADWPAMRDRIFGRIDADAESARDFRRSQGNVTTYDGVARFTGERSLSVTTADGEHDLTADRVVLAVGSRPVLPTIEGLDELIGTLAHTSETVMRLDELPGRVIVLGGGAIGAEFAHVYSALGAEVVQVHRGQRLLERFDDEISRRSTAQASWQLRLGRSATRVARSGDGLDLTLDDGSTLSADLLLVATGRRSNADRLALETAGVLTDEDGVIIVDDEQRTSVEGIWALGDCANHLQLKHAANHEARVVQHNLLHPDSPTTADHRFVPAAIFGHPQVATIGMTGAEAEEASRDRGTPYVSVVQEYADVAYGWALEDTGHCAKLIGDPTTGQLVGAHLIGPEASTLIQPLVQAMHLETPVAGLARGQYWIHPALTEVVENALLKLEREMSDATRS